jgi:outer membrane murein-binding lipoprotein Lpp
MVGFMEKTMSIRGVLAAAMVAILVVSGCGSGNTVEQVVGEINSNNVMRVASSYALFQQKNNYKGPKNKAAFVKFLNDPDISNNLDMMGFDMEDIESVFISERDNEEIKIRWGIKGSQRGCFEPVAFETTGIDGSRRIGFCNGKFEDVEDEGTYDEFFSGKHKPEENARKDSSAPKIDKNGNQVN